MTELKSNNPITIAEMENKIVLKLQPFWLSCICGFIGLFVLLIIPSLVAIDSVKGSFWDLRKELTQSIILEVNFTYFSFFVILACLCFVSLATVFVMEFPLMRFNTMKHWFIVFFSLCCFFCSFLIISRMCLGYENLNEIEKEYQTNYLKLSPQKIVAIQNNYKCCGRNFYDEKVCNGGFLITNSEITETCESTAIIEECIKPYMFKNPSKEGGCADKLLQDTTKIVNQMNDLINFHKFFLIVGFVASALLAVACGLFEDVIPEVLALQKSRE
jgi:hypothetical protein